MAEVRPRDRRRFADKGGDIDRGDRAGGLAEAAEMPAQGQRLVGFQECVGADRVLDHVAAAPLGDLQHAFDEVRLGIDDGIGAAGGPRDLRLVPRTARADDA